MMVRESEKIVEVLPNRLYWYSDASPSVGVTGGLYFCVDKKLKYSPYFCDNGPLNIAQVARFVSEVRKLLDNPQHKQDIIFHFTSDDPVHRLNAAFVMGCFMVC